MKLIGIYKITSPSGSMYIGQSRDIKKRWGSYMNLFCKDQPRLYNSLKKYGSENHIFEIIIECSASELNEKEKYYVDFFRTFNSEKGLNLRDGGGDKGYHSESTKIKIGLSKKGKKHTEETKKKISEAQKNPSPERREQLRSYVLGNKFRAGKKMPIESIERMRKSKIGKKASAETKIKMGKAHLGYKHSDESRKKMSDNKNKKIILNIENGIFYQGYEDVVLLTNIKRTTLIAQLTGQNKNKTKYIIA